MIAFEELQIRRRPTAFALTSKQHGFDLSCLQVSLLSNLRLRDRVHLAGPHQYQTVDPFSPTHHYQEYWPFICQGKFSVTLNRGKIILSRVDKICSQRHVNLRKT